MRSGIIPEERRENDGVFRGMETGPLIQQTITVPVLLPGKNPSKSDAFIIKPDDQRNFFIPNCEWDRTFVIQVVHGAVPSDGKRIIILPIPVYRCAHPYIFCQRKFTECKRQWRSYDKRNILIPNIIQRKTIGKPEGKTDLSIGGNTGYLFAGYGDRQ